MYEIKQLDLLPVFVTLKRVESMNSNKHYQLTHTWNRDYLLLYFPKGSGWISINGEKTKISKREAYLCKPEETYALTLKPDIHAFLFHFNMNGELPLEAERKMVVQPEQVQRYCYQLNSMDPNDNPILALQLQIQFQKMIYSILTMKRKLSISLEDRLIEAKKYIDEHFSKNIQIEHLARMAQVSEHYFVDRFKRQFGLSPIKYLHHQRLKKAKELLITLDFKLRDIASHVGIQDEYYFSRWFKKKTGYAPSEYRLRYKRKIAVSQRNYIGQLLALDIIPYAAPLHPKWTPYYYENYRVDIPVHLSAYKINERKDSNLDTLIDLSPDIIISDRRDQLEISEKLSDQTKVLSMYYGKQTWREQLMFIAKYLDEEKKAVDWLNQFNRKVANVREQLQTKYKSTTFLFIRKFKQSLYVNCNRTMSELFYGELGLLSALGTTICDHEISLEEIDQANPDHILFMICHEQETLQDWQEVKRSAEWNRLKAVKHQHVHLIPTDPWFEYSAIAHDRILDQLTEWLSSY